MKNRTFYPFHKSSDRHLAGHYHPFGLVLWCIPFFIASTLPQRASAQEPWPGLEQKLRERIAVHMVEELSSSAADFVMESNRDGLVVITKSLKRNLGFPEVQARFKPRFAAYVLKPVNRHRNLFRISALKCDFGTQANTVGYTRNAATGLVVQTRMLPISRVQKTGEGAILVPHLSVADEPKSALGAQLEEVANINRSWSAFQPALHPSGELIVFAANRQLESSRFDPDGTGKIDLYVSFKFGNFWTTPFKFDTLINSMEDELFPSFSQEGDLYFASNRPGGLGGFDLYKAHIDFIAIFANAQTRWWSQAKALPEPINSPDDELALCWTQDTLSKLQGGYFSRKTDQQMTDFDVYAFDIQGPLYAGKVIAANDETPIAGAAICIIDGQGDTTFTEANERGEFRLPLQFGRHYLFNISAQGYFAAEWQMIDANQLPQCIEPAWETIALEQAELPRRVIKGTVKSPDGRSLLSEAVIEFYSSDPQFVAPEITRAPDCFFVHTDRAVEFYIDAKSSMPTENTWHYDPKRALGQDTVEAQLVLHDTSYTIRRIVIVVEGTEEPANVVNALLGSRSHNGTPYREIGSDESSLSSVVRITIPAVGRGDCKLIVMATGAQPRILQTDQSGQELPDTLYLKPSQRWYESPLIVLHKYNEGQPDFSISEADLDAISLFLRADSLPGADDYQVCISAYTDCRGAQAYNQRLSEQRAEAVRAYIIAHTNASFEAKITARGLGIAPSVVPCAQCTPDMHQANRRTEIRLSHGGCADHSQDPITVR
jgi:hypothetical protein